MKVTLKLKSDSDNSYPKEEIEFTFAGDDVWIKMTDSDREVSVWKDDFVQLLRLIEN